MLLAFVKGIHQRLVDSPQKRASKGIHQSLVDSLQKRVSNVEISCFLSV